MASNILTQAGKGCQPRSNHGEKWNKNSTFLKGPARKKCPHNIFIGDACAKCASVSRFNGTV